MLVRAKSKYIRISPFKLRPVVDVVRGLPLDQALAWLQTTSLRRIEPVKKTILSAYANGKNVLSAEVPMNQFFIKEIRVDQGPIIKYFKPGAQGRANHQRKRLSHLQVVLERKEVKK